MVSFGTQIVWELEDFTDFNWVKTLIVLIDCNFLKVHFFILQYNLTYAKSLTQKQIEESQNHHLLLNPGHSLINNEHG